MIPDYFMFFFVFLIFAWIFAGRDEYLLPQIALIGAIVIETMIYVATMTPDTSISDVTTRYTILISPVLLYTTNIAYVTANILIEKPKKNNKEDKE